MTHDEWVSVLRLSTLWQLVDIRELAIERMSTFGIEPTDKIVLSQEFDVADWYEPACEELTTRSATLTMEEAKKIGLETAVRVFHAREQSRPCGCLTAPAAVYSVTSPIVAVRLSRREHEGVVSAAPEVSEDCTKNNDQKHSTEDARYPEYPEKEDVARGAEANENRLAAEEIEKEEATAAKDAKEDTTALAKEELEGKAATFVTKVVEGEVSTSISAEQAEENAAAARKMEEVVAARKAVAKKKAKEEAANAKKKTWQKAKDVAEKKIAGAKAGPIARVEACLAKDSTDLLSQKVLDRVADETSHAEEANHLARKYGDHLAQEEMQCFAMRNADCLAKDQADHDAKEEADRLAGKQAKRLVMEHLTRAEADRIAKQATDLLAQKKAKLLTQKEVHSGASGVLQRVDEQFARDELERIAMAEAAHLAKQKADYFEIGLGLAAKQEACRSVGSGTAKIDAEYLWSEAPDRHATAAKPTITKTAEQTLMALTDEEREIKRVAKKHRLSQLEEARAAAGRASSSLLFSLPVSNIGLPKDPLEVELQREAAKAHAEKKARRRLEIRSKKGSR